MDAGALPWGSPAFDVFKGLLPFLRLARFLHQGAMRDLKLAMCRASDDVIVYAHSYLLAPTADRTSDREFPAHEQCLLTVMVAIGKEDISSAIRPPLTPAGTAPYGIGHSAVRAMSRLETSRPTRFIQ
jgi:hypothetical protein